MRSHAKALVAALTLLLFCLGAAQAASAATPPVVAIEAASEVGFTSAKAKGSVDPQEKESFCHFEYIGDAQFAENIANSLPGFEGASQAPCDVEPLTGSGAQAVSAQLEGLASGTTYHLRLLASNEDGEGTAVAANFKTAEATPPHLTLKAPSAIGFTEADIAGEIDPEAGNVNPGGDAVPIFWQLQYTPASEPEGWQLAEDVTVGTSPIEGSQAEAIGGIEVKAHLSGLQNGTEYLYRLVASDAGHEVVSAETGEFETDPIAKPALTLHPAGALTAHSAHLSAGVEVTSADPLFDASCRFDYQTQANYEDNGGNWFNDAIAVPCTPATIEGSMSQPVEVSADVEKLEPNTTYRVRLESTNGGGASVEEETLQTLAGPPLVTTQGADHLQSQSATLNGEVNPQGSPTVYWFEWGTEDCSANPCQSVPLGEDADAGSGGEGVHVAQALGGLSPETTYHFRLVAENVAGTSEGDDHTFTTPAAGGESSCPNAGALGASRLPDCRAWEMASPPDKNGGDIPADTQRDRAAADGSAIGFTSLTAFGDAHGTGIATEYIAERDPGAGANGWKTHAITPQQGSPTSLASVGEPLYQGDFSTNLNRGVFYAIRTIGSEPNVANVANLYLRSDLRSPGLGSYQLLSACPLCEEGEPDVPLPPSLARLYFTGASADFGTVAFESIFNLAKPAEGSEYKLYESSQGVTRLAGILPDGTAAASSFAGLGSFFLRYTPRTVSADGSHVFFTANPDHDSRGDLYARIEGKVSVKLNASERISPESPKPAQFWSASSDGNRVFFTSDEKLSDSVTTPGQNGYLYMWEKQPTDEQQSLTVDATGGSFTLSLDGVSTDPISATATAAEVQAALEAIAPIGAGDVEVSGGPGDAGGSSPYLVTFVGALAGVDMAQLEADGSGLSGGAASATVATTHPIQNLTDLSVDQVGEDSPVVRYVLGSSEDGHYVYFLAGGRLAPGIPQRFEAGGSSGVYLWHDGVISYVGWLTNGSDPAKNTAQAIYTLQVESFASRVSPDGRHLLFMSHSDEGLKGRGGFAGYDQGSECKFDFVSGGPCRELYQYSADTGRLQCASCNPLAPVAEGDALIAERENSAASFYATHRSHALSDDGRYVFFTTPEALVEEDTNGQKDAYEYDTATGEPHLLSSGTSKDPSYFLDASASGRDVFIDTRERLSGWDTDTSYDVYDVRVNGGLPEPVPGTAPCSGDSCKGSAPGAPGAAPAGSAGFAGPGNPKAPRGCPKGKHRVKARKGKSRCVKAKQHKKRHTKSAKKHKRATDTNRRAGR